MYRTSQAFDNLISDISQYTDSKQTARTLVYVEMTLYLAKQLGLEAEPITIGWVLLSRLPLHHLLLKNLSAEQKRMYANAAIIVPLSSRFAWENTLLEYEQKISPEIRLYRIQKGLRLDEQMINPAFQQPSPDPLREKRYAEILSEQLPFIKRKQRHTTVGKLYKVHTKTDQGVRTGHVIIRSEMTGKNLNSWFNNPRPRNIITIEIDDLLPTAQFLDMRERQLGGREHWVRDLKQIRFRKAHIIDEQMHLEKDNIHPLHLEGMVHLPGMVSAGKTTLAKLIIAHCIRITPHIRITLVVGDSQTAISIAHQVNSWFFDDPNGEDVIAVPILGRTQRKIHLKRLFESREYEQSLKMNRPHWGERWLMPVCPLSSQIKWEGEQNVMIPAGDEPCTRLIEETPDRLKKGTSHLCPLFSTCPSQQIYRDMPAASLWVITPGALAQASLPLHLDPRMGKMGDLIYEQSDLVIFDEIETVIEWFDSTFAKTVHLTNGGDGLLDQLDTQQALAWSANRVIPSNERRWVMALRDSLKALTAILTAMHNPTQQRVVKDWVKDRPFAPNQLAYRLARRLAGLKEWDSKDISLDQRKENEARTQLAFAAFDRLLNKTPDPLRLQTETSEEDAQVNQLASLMQSINNLADDATDADILTQSSKWISQHYTDMEDRLKKLKQELQQSDDLYDKKYLEHFIDRDVEELAQRLQFMLTVALLDRHMHIITQEWHNKPDNLDAEQPFSRIPRGMRNILPLPLTGQQYGFSCDTTQNTPDANNRLSMFVYTNIGRKYILNYHQLRKDFDGLSGPSVLALSGTSWLPDSTSFHVDLPLAGVLVAPEQTETAIQESRFIWQPFVDEQNKPIFISGLPDKDHQLRKLVHAMSNYRGIPGGFIKKELAWLEKQANLNPDQWADRARILMLTNSYQQAETVAKTIRSLHPDMAETVFNLKQGVKKEYYEVEHEQNGILHRSDIEQFASNPHAKILIAPMKSIGRGFNILNNAPEAKAAFGTIFFLIRPMNISHNVNTTAQALNRYALEWAKDQSFIAWQEDTLYRRAVKARESAVELRRITESSSAYKYLRDDPVLGIYQRNDLAATTAGQIIQAVGRLLRGGVPFHAYFIDAAWSPELAKNGRLDQAESPQTSLLTAVIHILQDYAASNDIGYQLYNSLSETLTTTVGRDSN